MSVVFWSRFYAPTFKEAPSDAEIPSHKLLMRAGLVRKVSQGIYTYSSLWLRSLRKCEDIIRKEMNRIGCQEVFMPMVHPRSLWEETGRWDLMGDNLLKFQNRQQQWFCLGATHEEVIVDYVRGTLQSYRDLPLRFYQIQTKFRDEIRPRFGLMRAREFLMKDAYSFDLDEKKAQESYWEFFEAYERIFKNLQIPFRAVEADTGNIGGQLSHEFHVLADVGEDRLMVTPRDPQAPVFASNVEICPAISPEPAVEFRDVPPLERFATPNVKSMEDLSTFTGLPLSQLAKSVVFDLAAPGSPAPEAILVIVRGDHEVNPIKVKRWLKLDWDPRLLPDDQVFRLFKAHSGSLGPVGSPIPVFVDDDVLTLPSLVCGANVDGYHYRHVVLGRDFQASAVGDFRWAQPGDLDPIQKRWPLQMVRGIEVGHVFYLGTKYSEPMKLFYLDPQGSQKPVYMGCYGIGVSRTLQAVIESCHDQWGIKWPVAVAPFHVHVTVLDAHFHEALRHLQDVLPQLEKAGLEVFVDDRPELRPGVKFHDADLLGFPVRVVLGGKTFSQGLVEWVSRADKKSRSVSLSQWVSEVISYIQSQKSS